MTTEPVLTPRNPWFRAGVGITAVLAVLAAAAGMVWLPWTQAAPGTFRVWEAICHAAGVPVAAPGGPVVAATYPTTTVVVTPQMLHSISEQAISEGATLALRCAMCHGPQGLSMANSPNLAGQYAQVVYKQLRDYNSGARVNAVMQPMAALLDQRQMRELAGYYQSLPRLAPQPTGGPVPRIVSEGAPMRGIAPCTSCHGTSAHTAGSPWLYGEPYVYLRDQLIAFASGRRHNDIDAQMRNVARPMTPDEIEHAAAYYAGSK